MKHAIRIFTVVAPYLGVTLVFLVFFFLADDHWHGAENLRTIGMHTIVVGIGALGMTLVIICGGIDLSVGSVLALGMVVPALILRGPDPEAPLTMDQVGLGLTLLAIFVGLLACSGVGLANGVVSAGFGIVPFIVTLGTMLIVRGLAKFLAHNAPVYVDGSLEDEHWLLQLMQVNLPDGAQDHWYYMPSGTWILLALTVIVALVLRYTVFGRYLYAIGSNEAAARLCGINVTGYRILVYTLMGLFMGIASLLEFSLLTVGSPTEGVALELNIIAAVVIGGGSLNGGEGSAIGSVLGALMMTMMKSGCNFMGISDSVQYILVGSVIIGAVGIDRLKHSNWMTTAST